MYQMFHNRTSYFLRKTKRMAKINYLLKFIKIYELFLMPWAEKRQDTTKNDQMKKMSWGTIKIKALKDMKKSFKIVYINRYVIGYSTSTKLTVIFLTHLVQIICQHGWTRWAKGFSSQREHKSYSSSSSSQNKLISIIIIIIFININGSIILFLFFKLQQLHLSETPQYLFVLRGVQIVPGVFLISHSTFRDFGHFWFIYFLNILLKMIILDENSAFRAISLSMAS